MRYVAWVIIGLLVVGYAGRWIAFHTPDVAAAAREPRELVTVAGFAPRSENGLASADFTIANANAFAIRDIQITCAFIGRSGTTIAERAVTVYDVIQPKDRRTFRNLRIGYADPQTATVGCRVIAVNR